MSIILGRFGTFVETTGAQTITNSVTDQSPALTLIKTNGGPALQVQGKQVFVDPSGKKLTLTPFNNIAVPHRAALQMTNDVDGSQLFFNGNTISSATGRFMQTGDNVGAYNTTFFDSGSTSINGTTNLSIAVATGSSFNCQLWMVVLVTAITGGTVTLNIAFTDKNGSPQTLAFAALNSIGQKRPTVIMVNCDSAGVTLSWVVTGTITFEILANFAIIYALP